VAEAAWLTYEKGGDKTMTSSNGEADTAPAALSTKVPWEPMTLGYVGDVTALVLAGEGKVSGLAGDMGEPNKKPSPGSG